MLPLIAVAAVETLSAEKEAPVVVVDAADVAEMVDIMVDVVAGLTTALTLVVKHLAALQTMFVQVANIAHAKTE